MTSFKPIICEAKTDRHSRLLSNYKRRTNATIEWLSDSQSYLLRIHWQQYKHVYRLMFIRDESEEVVDILGFRVEEYLWWTLTVDDFATLRRARGKGLVTYSWSRLSIMQKA